MLPFSPLPKFEKTVKKDQNRLFFLSCSLSISNETKEERGMNSIPVSTHVFLKNREKKERKNIYFCLLSYPSQTEEKNEISLFSRSSSLNLLQ